MNKKSFLGGAAVLAVAGLFVKIIGAVYRIPLQNIISLEGMARYGASYAVYTFLLVISSAGIPSAISKMVSEHVATGDYRGAHGVFEQSYRLLLLLGVSTAVLMAALSKPYSAITVEGSYLSLLALSPSLLFVALISAYRGYFQGMQNMAPTAVSQVVEQLGKLLVGFTLASRLMPLGSEYGAMGAVIGVTSGELLALVLMMGYYARKRRDMRALLQAAPQTKSVGFRQVTGRLLAIAIPITIGASIMPLMSTMDSLIVVSRLAGIGYSAQAAEQAYGLLTGSVNPLVNMPAVLTLALCMSLVPAISSASATRRDGDVRQAASVGIKLAICIGMPCAAGLLVLAKPILAMLFRSSLTGQNLDVAAELLQIMSVGVLFLSLVQAVTGILQGLGKPGVAVVNLLIGAALKLVISFVLIGIPQINIVGATVGSVVCYAVAGILDTVQAVRRAGVRFNIVEYVVKPLAAAFCMGAFVHFTYSIFFEHVFGQTLGVVICIGAAVFVYGCLLIFLKALRQEDFALIPGGNRFYGMLKSIGLY